MNVPVFLLFYLTFFLFTLEYDKKMSEAWKKKEKKLIQETYAKYVKEYHKKKKEEENTAKLVETGKKKRIQQRIKYS